MTATDVFRILTLQLGVIMIVLTVIIVIRYARMLKATPRIVPRLLPIHVATIASSFIVLASSGMAEIILRFGEPATWRVPVLFLGFALANVAQASMYHVIKTQKRGGMKGAV